MITLKNRQRRFPLNLKKIERTVERILTLLKYPDFDIGILFTTNKTIQRYNKQYRHKDKPTDILSFSYHHLTPGQRIQVTEEEDKNLGDLILSIEYIDKHRLNRSLEDRLTVLLIHGICHLLGYDHETDRDWRSMRAKEAYLLKKLS